MPSWSLPELSYAPLRDRLQEGVHHLRTLEDEVDFAVLFGSATRGEARRGSDLDLLLGLRKDGSVRFMDRIDRFTGWCPAVEAFPYYPSELRLMESQLHMTLLEAADHGLALFDRGSWAEIRQRLRGLMDGGRVVRRHRGWWVRDKSLVRRAEGGSASPP